MTPFSITYLVKATRANSSRKFREMRVVCGLAVSSSPVPEPKTRMFSPFLVDAQSSATRIRNVQTHEAFERPTPRPSSWGTVPAHRSGTAVSAREPPPSPHRGSQGQNWAVMRPWTGPGMVEGGVKVSIATPQNFLPSRTTKIKKENGIFF